MHSDAFDGSGTVSSFSVTSNADCYGGGAWLGCKGRLVPADCVPSTWFDIAGSTGVRIAPPAQAETLIAAAKQGSAIWGWLELACWAGQVCWMTCARPMVREGTVRLTLGS